MAQKTIALFLDLPVVDPENFKFGVILRQNLKLDIAASLCAETQVRRDYSILC